MASVLNGVENEGVIVFGRVVDDGLDSPDKIRATAQAIDALGAKLGLRLGLVYAGTTINWPEIWESPCLIGVVTHVDHGSDEDEDEPNPLPREALAQQTIPDEAWTTICNEHGIELVNEIGTYLVATGWTWTRIETVSGERLLFVSGEDDAYIRIDDERLLNGDEPLQMCTSYL